MPLYAKLSNGQTTPFSKKLIRSEKFALSGAWIFDRIGDKYQRKDIAYMKNEFVEMSMVADFSPQYPDGIDFNLPLRKINLEAFCKLAKQLNAQKQFNQLVQHCTTTLEELVSQSHVYCMVRHLIESIRRVAFFIPVYEQQCKTLNIKAPTVCSQRLIWLHIIALPESEKFDIAVSSIQNKNIPFIYQDLPHIPIDVVN